MGQAIQKVGNTIKCYDKANKKMHVLTFSFTGEGYE